MTDLDVCRTAPNHCKTAFDYNGARYPGDAASRGLCWPCERHGRWAIEQLPRDWWDLSDRLSPGSSGGGSVAGSRTEAPIPVNLGVDALMREIAYSLTAWEIRVRDVASLSDVPARGVRDRVAVSRAAAILTGHFPVLLALPPEARMPYDSTEPSDEDGPGAVVELTSLHHRARTMLGLTVRRERRELPCPLIPCERHGAQRCTDKACAETVSGCGQFTLAQELGGDTVTCDWCGYTMTLDEYAAYTTRHALRLAAPRRLAA